MKALVYKLVAEQDFPGKPWLLIRQELLWEHKDPKDPALTLWHSRRFVKLPGQQDLTALQVFPFSSIGVGERFQIFRHFFLSWEVKNFFTEKKKNLSLGKFYSNKNELQSMEDSKCLFDHPF